MGKRRKDADVRRSGSVSLWHPWQDKPGVPYALMRLQSGSVFSAYHEEPLFDVSTVEHMVEIVSKNGLYLFCEDVLSTREIPYIRELLGYEGVVPFVSRTGNVSAIRVKREGTGYIIPISTWSRGDLDNEILIHLDTLYKVFGYQATSPASLSEKVLRSTLPERIRIYRPARRLRKDILDNHRGGRIDRAKPEFLPYAVSYDKSKAYLDKSRLVPSPWKAPVHRYRPPISCIGDYVEGFWHTRMVARSCAVAPLILKSGRIPVDGECIQLWLWTGEIIDCVEAGFTLLSIEEGYGFLEMSDFMVAWTDILWEKYLAYPELQPIIKQMMVGLPGRFLRKPEQYRLVGIEESRRGDTPLRLKWTSYDEPRFSDLYIRGTSDPESTALSVIGAYIPYKMRQELYHRMLAEHRAGTRVLRSYIDCYTLNRPTIFQDDLGTERGMWKEQSFHDVYIESNRMMGSTPDGESYVKCPTDRTTFLQRAIALKEAYYEDGFCTVRTGQARQD